MYRYTESGLRGVRLQNGYTVHQTSHGRAVSIIDVEGLHRAIGRTLAHKSRRLAPSEFRFLRKELGLSQRALAALLGGTEQNISLWERRGRVPALADRFIRILYIEHLNGDVKVRAAVEALAELDRAAGDDLLVFSRSDRKKEWREAA